MLDPMIEKLLEVFEMYTYRRKFLDPETYEPKSRTDIVYLTAYTYRIAQGEQTRVFRSCNKRPAI